MYLFPLCERYPVQEWRSNFWREMLVYLHDNMNKECSQKDIKHKAYALQITSYSKIYKQKIYSYKIEIKI